MSPFYEVQCDCVEKPVREFNGVEGDERRYKTYCVECGAEAAIKRIGAA